jgi:hypothetical protein
MVFLLEPGFPAILGVSFHWPRLVGQTLFQQTRVQVLERRYFRDGNPDIASATAYAVLHAAFFMALSWCTTMAFKQLGAAEGQASGLFLALMANPDRFHGGVQIVVADAMRTPFDERFPFLVGKGHDKYSPGRAPAPGEQLHR